MQSGNEPHNTSPLVVLGDPRELCAWILAPLCNNVMPVVCVDHLSPVGFVCLGPVAGLKCVLHLS